MAGIPPHAQARQLAELGEIEIGVLRSQCLDLRIDNKGTIIAEVAAWEQGRNAEVAQIRWMFTPERAREKLRKAYSVKEPESLWRGTRWPSKDGAGLSTRSSKALLDLGCQAKRRS